MAKTKMDATTPLYAMVGAGDLAVSLARTAAADVQSRLAKIELPRIDVRNVDLRRAATDAQARLSQEPAVVLGQIDELADRGKTLVGRIRGQQATRTTAQAARTTAAKAKTAKTQTEKAASEQASTTKQSAKRASTSARKTASTAKRNAKATGTSARKTASAASKAAEDAASKVGD